MIIRSASFVKSSAGIAGCPDPVFPEYAFIGRSNVGKSSLINMLTGYGKLAKISAAPGKTRHINHFLINNAWYLCDLPGYGFARVPVPVKKKWEDLIRKYLRTRENLVCAFVLIDLRHGPMKNDMDFLRWVGENGIPLCLVLTKADKLSPSRIRQHTLETSKTLSGQWDPLPPMIVSSSETGEGKAEILERIAGWNTAFAPRQRPDI